MSGRAFIATFGTAIALIVVFLVLDTALARVDRRENALHAASEYEEGRAALARGDAAGAREHFASAVAGDRRNTTYALGLAQAMIAEGRAGDAETALTALLDRAGNSGAANLVMARLLNRSGRRDEAAVFYHRAIVGQWAADSTARRTEARFELIDLLAEQHDEQAMLGELLPLEASFPDSAALQRRLAHLFIRAGAPRRGLAILRDMIRADPHDADAYAGLGEAALALGNFVTARADFAEAARLRPDEPRIAARLALADTIVALDPDLRRLSLTERAARARITLQRTLAEAARCGDAARASGVADSARAAMAVITPTGGATAPEHMIEYAVTLGRTITARCPAGGSPDEVVTLLLRKLDQ